MTNIQCGITPDIARKRSEMTNDKQIEAAFDEWAWGNPQNGQSALVFAEKAFKAAIAATHEQYKPLVKALEMASKLIESFDSVEPRRTGRQGDYVDAVKATIKQALANLPEELKNV